MTFRCCAGQLQLTCRVKLVVSLGWLLIVVGVAGEFVADSFVSKADGFVQKFDEILLADAQKKTGVASERAARAFESAAQSVYGLDRCACRTALAASATTLERIAVTASYAIIPV